MTTLGQRIREHRRRAGLSQEALARRMDVSRQAVTKWESGQSAPSTENLFRLAESCLLPAGPHPLVPPGGQLPAGLAAVGAAQRRGELSLRLAPQQRSLLVGHGPLRPDGAAGAVPALLHHLRLFSHRIFDGAGSGAPPGGSGHGTRALRLGLLGMHLSAVPPHGAAGGTGGTEGRDVRFPPGTAAGGGTGPVPAPVRRSGGVGKSGENAHPASSPDSFLRPDCTLFQQPVLHHIPRRDGRHAPPHQLGQQRQDPRLRGGDPWDLRPLPAALHADAVALPEGVPLLHQQKVVHRYAAARPSSYQEGPHLDFLLLSVVTHEQKNCCRTLSMARLPPAFY